MHFETLSAEKAKFPALMNTFRKAGCLRISEAMD
jgi:hypothetical protein